MDTPEGSVDISLMDPILEQYAQVKGALIPVLQKVQELYGYLPPEALRIVAKKMDIPLSKVFGVATFYSQFYLERRGRHILKVCDGTACHVKGTPGLLNTIREELGVEPGQTTPDFEYSVEVVYCMGSCALAPVVVLDSKVMGRMRREVLLKQIKPDAGLVKEPGAH